MIKFARILVPAVFALGAAGANAQLIETDYPVVTGSVGAGVVAPAQTAAAPAGNAEPFLIQSNAGPVQVNPAYEQASSLTRAEVQAGAEIRNPIGPAFSA
ncbi:MAG: hypothetical protein ABS55_09150 [Lautropia sp. SCN 70-15]|jgi:hypothetical protein|nr:MAG: hypothetical protein ABS55_09150 [Lautropia sp. SCN 70-15]